MMDKAWKNSKEGGGYVKCLVHSPIVMHVL